MRSFNSFVSLLSTIFALFFISACDSSNEKICPECHMQIASSAHSASLHVAGEELYFDDIGCMVLYANKHNINLNTSKVAVFVNDSKRVIDAQRACYILGEDTPMRYGFGAYEYNASKCMKFNEVILKMLRGENMSNPKIRKRVLKGEL
ncbi:hypothetical protein [Sulfurimonas sp.]